MASIAKETTAEGDCQCSHQANICLPPNGQPPKGCGRWNIIRVASRRGHDQSLGETFPRSGR
jgi:hypothetical protein